MCSSLVLLMLKERLHEHQISIQENTFGLCEMGQSHHGCAVDKSEELCDVIMSE